MILTTINNCNTNIFIPKPLSKQVSWKPIKNNGKPLTNMILKSIEGTLEFHLNLFSRLFYFTFIVFGSLFTVYATYALLSYHFETTLWSVLVGFTLMGVGIYMFSKQATPHIFDKEKNLYFIENENCERENKIPLNDISSLQVISYTEENEDKKEQQAELNLVLTNGKRVYVCSYDEDKYQRAKKDAQIISQYINKPILRAC